MLRFAAALVLFAATGTQASALDGPEELVRALYARNSIPENEASADRFLSADLAGPYKAQLASEEVEPAVGFDWRYDAQEFQITDLEIRSTPVIQRDGLSYADVDVTFANFGERKEITFSLCLGRSGWRIYDARSRDGEEDWSLRETLLRVEGKVSC